VIPRFDGLDSPGGSAAPRDAFLLDLSEACQADYLVTGDKNGLPALIRHQSTRIIPQAGAILISSVGKPAWDRQHRAFRSCQAGLDIVL
jgi:hypothetical protein